MEKEFNLLDEDWVKVVSPKFAIKEISLKEAIAHSHEYIALGGEMEAQNVAMIRLMLAIVHSAFAKFDANGQEKPLLNREDAITRWKEYWNCGHFPETIVESLERYRERFWLFHLETPFYQANESKCGTGYAAAKLNGEISESNNRTRIFAMRSGEIKSQLTYAEAARWILFINGYDDTSVKPSRAGMPSVGVGWLGQITTVVAKGRNLFETLMLNLVPLQNGNGDLWPKPCPIWEVPQRTDERKKIEPPSNPAELFTHQSRRILLKRQNGVVTGFNVLGGEFFDAKNVASETMAIMNLPDKDGTHPIRLFADVPVWTLFDKIFCSNQQTINWLHLLEIDSATFCVCGMRYDTKTTKIVDEYAETFNADIAADFANYVSIAVELCRCIANEIGTLSYNIQLASGSQNPNGNAKAEFLEEIGPNWNAFISGIIGFDDFQNRIKQFSLDFAKILSENASPTSLKGRTVERNGLKWYCCTSKAYNSFLYQLDQLIPEACTDYDTAKQHLHCYLTQFE